MNAFLTEALFPTVLNMSLTASAVILVVLLARFLLRRAPTVFSYALWAAVPAPLPGEPDGGHLPFRGGGRPGPGGHAGDQHRGVPARGA